MTQDMQNPKDPVGSRTQVAKNQKYTKLKEKMLLLGVILICAGIALGGFLPKRKNTSIIEEDGKDNTTLQLNQNMELIAALREKAKNSSGYQGGDPNHPPLLKAMENRDSDTLTKETLARMNAPSTFFSVNSGESQAQSGARHQGQNKTLMGHDANSEFLNQQEDITAVRAKQLPHPKWTVPAGEMIPATLETAINSELAGMIRAITLRDIYALSGDKLLIPKGTTFIGQFNTAMTQGQTRIFAVWNRLQMSNGIIVTLNSPSSDSIGRSGLAADYINRHFFERFSSGALLSVLGATTALSGVHGQDEYNSMSQYRMNVAGSFQQAANQTLQQEARNNTTGQTNQGAAINIFAAHDLDFYSVAGRL